MWDFLPVALTVAGSLTSAMGAYSAGSAAAANGARQQAAAQFTAAQLEQQAGQTEASGQRAGAEQTRQAMLLNSRALALAAASGGGATDPTVVTLLSRTAAEGAYRSAVAIYQSEEQARQLRLKAAATSYEGDLALASGQDKQKAYETAAFGSLLTGAASLYSKYGMGGPGKSADTTYDSWDFNPK